MEENEPQWFTEHDKIAHRYLDKKSTPAVKEEEMRFNTPKSEHSSLFLQQHV